jgi:hypothetical protein
MRTIFVSAMLLVVLAAAGGDARAAAPEFVALLNAGELGDAAFFDRFGTAVDIDGDIAVVGVPQDDVGDFFHAGSVYVYRRTLGVWSLEQKLVAPVAKINQRFGTAVALDGTTLAIGAVGEGDGAINFSGAVFVFDRTDGEWSLTQKLAASAPALNELLGMSVDLVGDVLVAGAPNATVSGVTNAGAIDVFLRTDGAWAHSQRVEAPMPISEAQMGKRVVLTSTWLAASLWNDTPSGSRVAVFEVQQGLWGNMQTLGASDGASSNGFGISLSAFGDRLAVGASGTASNVGAAYIFDRTGVTWTETAKLVGSGTPDARFGRGLALMSNRLLVGEPDPATNGRVIPFELTLGTWTALPPVTRNTGEVGDQYGTVLAIDGDTAIVGVPTGEVAGVVGDTGVATIVDWTDAAPVFGQEFDTGFPSAAGRLGESVDIAADIAVVGAPEEVSRLGYFDSGAAYVYQRSGAAWNLLQRLSLESEKDTERFGHAVAIDGDWLAISEPDSDEFGLHGSGVVHLYQLSNGLYAHVTDILPADPNISYYFGTALALNAGVLVVGAPSAGVAYVFEASAGWGQTAKLQAPVPAASAWFGRAIDVSSETIVIGATGEEGGTPGGVHVFERNAAAWEWITTLEGSTVEHDAFGYTVKLVGDELIIGAPQATVAGDDNRGRLQLYRRGNDGVWIDDGELIDQTGSPAAYFGSCLAVTGSTLFAGASGTDGYVGKVASFVRIGDQWVADASIDAQQLSGTVRELGSACAANDSDLIVGSPGRSGEPPFGNPFEGGAFVFRTADTHVFADGFEEVAAP